MHADDFGSEEIDRLAQHPRFGLNASDAPANNAEPVDHGGVGIGADPRIRIVQIALIKHALGEVLEVHLMDDADARRHHPKRLERLLAPFQELIAFAVAFELHVQVELQRLGGTGKVDLYGMVDDQVHRHQRLDHLRVATEPGHRGAHRRQIHQERNARKIL